MHIADEYFEKNFIHMLHTGKRLGEGEVDPSIYEYDPYQTIPDNISTLLKTPPTAPASAAKGQEAKGSYLAKILQRLFGQEREKRLKAYERILKSQTQPPDVIKRAYTELQKSLDEHSYGFLDYLGFLYDWCKGRLERARKSDISAILEYLVFDFTPRNDDDFPYGLLTTTKDKVAKIIRLTGKPDPNNPKHWTWERFNQYESLLKQGEVYKALVITSVGMYAWYVHKLQRKFPNDAIIRLKYIVDYVLGRFSFVSFTDLIVLKHEVIKNERIKFLFSCIDDICHSLEIHPCHLLLDDQCEKFFVLKTDELPKSLISEVIKIKQGGFSIDSSTALRILSSWDVLVPARPFSLQTT